MTEQEKIGRSYDLQEMIQGSKGYRWLIKHIEEEIRSDQDAFLSLSNDEADDYKRFEKQVRLKLLNELKEWSELEVSRGRSADMLQAARQAKNATIHSGLAGGSLMR